MTQGGASVNRSPLDAPMHPASLIGVPGVLRKPEFIAAIGIAVFALAACATVEIPPPDTLLSEAQVTDLILHPQRWYGRVVRIEIYPYGMGTDRTALVCFERCDEARAERSSYLIDGTRAGQFTDYRGDRAVVVNARYESNCALLPDYTRGGRPSPYCPDFFVARFVEVD